MGVWYGLRDERGRDSRLACRDQGEDEEEQLGRLSFEEGGHGDKLVGIRKMAHVSRKT